MNANTTDTNAPVADATPEPAEVTDTYEPSGDDYAALEAEISTDTGESDTDTETDGHSNREARYRLRLRETEAERDQLRDQLAAERRALIDWRASTTHGGVDAALLDAANIDTGALLGESGTIDMSLVDKFIGDTASRFRVAPGFKPNRAQGQSGHSAAAPPSLADAFRRR